jgi:uncharacterized protein
MNVACLRAACIGALLLAAALLSPQSGRAQMDRRIAALPDCGRVPCALLGVEVPACPGGRCALVAAAASGDRRAEFWMGVAAANGLWSQPKSLQSAVTWWKKAADQGEHRAQNALGEVYARGAGAFPQDLERASAYLFQAAAGGDAYANYNLALLYEKGLVIEPDAVADKMPAGAAPPDTIDLDLHAAIVQNTIKAVQRLELAAAGGVVPAMMRLAGYYERGDGVKRDCRRALSLYTAAARGGSAAAKASAERLAHCSEE